jgi:hypothetical protein
MNGIDLSRVLKFDIFSIEIAEEHRETLTLEGE